MHKEMRRKDRLVTEENAREIIENSDYGMLCTASLSGEPYAVAVSHVLHENSIYFHCAQEGRKIENIRENPQVCISFVKKADVVQEHYTVKYQSAVAEGIVTLIEDEAEKLFALKLICQRYSPDMLENHLEYIQPRIKHTAIGRIDLTSLSGKANNRG